MCERRQQTDWGRAEDKADSEEMKLTVCLVSSVLGTYEFSCSLMIFYVYTYAVFHTKTKEKTA